MKKEDITMKPDFGVAEERINFLQQEFSDLFADNLVITRAMLQEIMSNLDNFYGFYKNGDYKMQASDDFTVTLMDREEILKSDPDYSEAKVLKAEFLQAFVRQQSMQGGIRSSGIKFSTFRTLRRSGLMMNEAENQPADPAPKILEPENQTATEKKPEAVEEVDLTASGLQAYETAKAEVTEAATKDEAAAARLASSAAPPLDAPAAAPQVAVELEPAAEAEAAEAAPAAAAAVEVVVETPVLDLDLDAFETPAAPNLTEVTDPVSAQQYQAYLRDIYETVKIIATPLSNELSAIGDKSCMRRIQINIKDKNYIALIVHWKNNSNIVPHKILIAYCEDSAENSTKPVYDTSLNTRKMLEDMYDKINLLTDKLAKIEKEWLITGNNVEVERSNADTQIKTQLLDTDTLIELTATENVISDAPPGSDDLTSDSGDNARQVDWAKAAFAILKAALDNISSSNSDLLDKRGTAIFKDLIDAIENEKVALYKKNTALGSNNPADLDTAQEEYIYAIESLREATDKANEFVSSITKINNNSSTSLESETIPPNPIPRTMPEVLPKRIQRIKQATKSNKGRNIDNNKVSFFQKIKNIKRTVADLFV